MNDNSQPNENEAQHQEICQEKKERLAMYISDDIIKQFADERFELLRGIHPNVYAHNGILFQLADKDYVEIKKIFYRVVKRCIGSKGLEELAGKVITNMDDGFMKEVELIEEPGEPEESKGYKAKIYEIFAAKTRPAFVPDKSSYDKMYLKSMFFYIDAPKHDGDDNENKEKTIKNILLKHFCTDTLIMDEKVFNQLVNEGKDVQEIADLELKAREKKSSESVVEIAELNTKIKRSAEPNPDDERRVEMLTNIVNKINKEDAIRKS